MRKVLHLNRAIDPRRLAKPGKVQSHGATLRRPMILLTLVLAQVVVGGCHRFSRDSLDFQFAPEAPPPIEVPVSNPAHIGNVDPEFLWRMIVDAVDDHFRIENENPVRRDPNNWQEGRLTTYPEISGTSFEPWRRDAARGFERLQSTIQTIRRSATIRVANEPTGYQVEVEVLKEQEDVDQSLFASAGTSSQRHDGTVVRNGDQVRQTPVTLGWYEIGRDRDLERRIMEGILGRITNVNPPRRGLLH